MSRSAHADSIQGAFLGALQAEGFIIETMSQVAAHATDPAAKGLFEHLGRAGRNVLFIKELGLINFHVRSELRGWWNILISVKEDLDWLHRDFRVHRYFILLIGRNDKHIADGYIFSDFNAPVFIKPPGVEATKFTINEKQHLDPDKRIRSLNKIAKALLERRAGDLGGRSSAGAQ